MTQIAEIPAGDYEIGDDLVPNASPRHCRRFRSSIWIDIAPVSWSHFEVFVASGGYDRPELWEHGRSQGVQRRSVDERCRNLLEETVPFRRTISDTGKLSRHQPVTGLTWFEAQAIARFYAARLPFESEWEVAMTLASSAADTRNGGARCLHGLGYLQEWTADAYSTRYWRADFDRIGNPWTSELQGAEVVVRGASAADLHQHVSFRRGDQPGSAATCRSFRRVWEQYPPVKFVEPTWLSES